MRSLPCQPETVTSGYTILNFHVCRVQNIRDALGRILVAKTSTEDCPVLDPTSQHHVFRNCESSQRRRRDIHTDSISRAYSRIQFFWCDAYCLSEQRHILSSDPLRVFLVSKRSIRFLEVCDKQRRIYVCFMVILSYLSDELQRRLAEPPWNILG
jgi:hypothetical protein